MIDGIWWLVILITVIAVLWLLAHLRGNKNIDAVTSDNKSVAQPSAHDALQKTALLLKQYFPDYHVSRRDHHLLISKQDKKIAMITIDKKLVAGQRYLGDVIIMNYHGMPSRTQLSDHLQAVK